MTRKYFSLKRRKRELEKLLTEIPGEPCAGILAHCKHPVEHERWFLAKCELQDVDEALFNLPLIRFWRVWRNQIIAAAIGGLVGFALGHQHHYSKQTLELYDALHTNKFTIEPFVFYGVGEHYDVTGDVEKWETVTGQLRIEIRERTNSMSGQASTNKTRDTAGSHVAPAPHQF